MRTHFYIIISLVFAISAGPLYARLVFKQTSHLEKAEVGQEELEVVFPFHNGGAEVVRVLDIDSSCGCLSAKTDRKVYEPGQRGEFKARFKIGSMVGRHNKVLYLKTNLTKKSKGPSHELVVGVEVPEVISVIPKVLKWKVGEEPVAQKYEVEIKGENPIGIREIHSTRQNMRYELKVLEAGRKYEISLVPNSTAQPIMGALRLLTDSKIRKYRRKMVFFSITKPKKLQGVVVPSLPSVAAGS